ncbi:glycosyltransferase family 4 protein [Deminuibacter soli]|uniref:Glycosyltransferase n=1 Tax=Deminuibacter soli TaxID=2291815 RepID=A0A3E1NHH8_9BACT|nr:glycosyltransferase family 4 protein [Deminuibacter soli]RFM27400.1 glycosyltransferase [Deminuibacter soli]
MKKIIFINSHPIQYFAPLYKYLAQQDVPVEAWYCSDASIKGIDDKGFGVKVKWDIPLLEGYASRFFKNHSWKPSHFNGFFGLINLGIIRQLRKEPKAIIVVHGWAYCTHFLVLMLAKLMGHEVCLRSEMPYNQELMKAGIKQRIKRMGLKYLLFPRIHKFLYIGTQNKRFYESYGIAENRLFFCPYSVDNMRFQAEAATLAPQKILLKESKGIPAGDKVIIYSGKYIAKKRPLDIINAFLQLNKPGVWLIMVGEGELRGEMEKLLQAHESKRVILTGFINQSEIARYYTLGDVFVMCSTIGETWGLSVNEAMNFGLSLLISETTGCSIDLVQEGANGFVFKTGSVDDLSNKLQRLLTALEKDEAAFREKSLKIVDKYSYKTIYSTLKAHVV